MRTSGLALAALAATAAGCAHGPENAPLGRADPAAGYRLQNVRRAGQSDDLLLFLAFSGGGTRAASPHASFTPAHSKGGHRRPSRTRRESRSGGSKSGNLRHNLGACRRWDREAR